ncbi:MAG TPA: hypothetical protein VFH96_05045 [Pyrinomonadaceae bacterium]|nr:hypothetical protein [Pyrinomonadaceae bacterium]
MPDHKHLESIEGSAKPADIFQPYLQGVELFEDMDAVFQEARQLAAGEHPSADIPEVDHVKRGVAVVTPGRLIMLDPCPDRDSVRENELLPMLAVLPPKSPLNISVISHTRIEALHQDMTKAIPFRGYLLAWATAGHNVIVFEGHPSAFESGVRDADVLLMDSGMLPFVQFNWVEAAFRVMQPDGKIFLHDRKKFGLSIISKPEGQPAPKPNLEANYVEFLLRILMNAAQTSAEITAGEMVPDLLGFATKSTDRNWLNHNIERDKLNPEKVIDILVHRAGWRWYNSFKTTRKLKFRVPLTNGTVRNYPFTLTLTKNVAGKRQLRIER